MRKRIFQWYQKIARPYAVKRVIALTFGAVVTTITGWFYNQFFQYEKVVLNYTVTDSKRPVAQGWSKCYTCKDKIDTYTQEILLLNRGNLYLDFDRILWEQTVYYTPAKSGFQIHQMEILAVTKSRSSLPIQAKIIGRDTLAIEFSGNEAMEKFDGAMIKFRYQGNLVPQWKLSARIKGIPPGFARIGTNYFSEHSIQWGLIGFILVFFIAGGLFLWGSISKRFWFQQDSEPIFYTMVMRILGFSLGIGLVGGAFFLAFSSDRLNMQVPMWAIEKRDRKLWFNEHCGGANDMLWIERNAAHFCHEE
ncbi:MAG: hypothetical protein AAF998_15060 [Bacteroidota bacterium]